MNTSFNINQHFEDGEISMDRFHEQVATLLGGNLVGLHTSDSVLIVETMQALGDSETAKLKAIMAEHRADKHHLPTMKAIKFGAIDARTRDLFDEGFEKDGCKFSLSIGAQVKLLRLDAIRFELEYPVTLNSLGDDTSYTVATPEGMHELVVYGLLRVHEIVESGTDLKDLVRAARTTQEVARIIDPR